MVTQPSWARPGWLAEVEAWVDSRLAGLGLRRTGELEGVKVRAWSAVLAVPVEGGRLYFKALPPGLEHEVALTARLAEWIPDLVVPVLAADEARGWMLMPDAGPRLRDVLKPADFEKTWTALLEEYAEMQIAAAPKASELLALGVPDRRLAHFSELLDHIEVVAQGLGAGGGFAGDEPARLRTLRPALVARADRLAAFGLPETVEHDDLHDGNVLMSEGRPVIFDWGDACISHPFFSLRVALLSTKERFGLADDAPVLSRLRDAYLRRWLGFAPMASLGEAFQLSRPLAILPRILSWDLAMKNASGRERAGAADFIVALLRELLETPLAD